VLLPKPTIQIGGTQTLLTAGNIGLTPQKPLPSLPPAFTQSVPKSHSTTPESVTKVLFPTPTSLELTNEQLRQQESLEAFLEYVESGWDRRGPPSDPYRPI